MAKNKYKNILTKEFLIDQYTNKKLSSREIAKNIGSTKSPILRYLKKHDIERRDASYRNEDSKYIKTRLTKEFLYEEYKVKQRSLKDIGKELNCTKRTVSKYVKRYGLEINVHGYSCIVKCSTCGKDVKRYGYEIAKSKDSFCSKTCFNKHRSLYNPMHNKETRLKVSLSLKNLTYPPNAKNFSYCCMDCGNLIHWKTALYGDGRCKNCNPTGNYYCYYNKRMFRSSWEANFAKWCDGSGIKCEFEPQAFNLTIDGKDRTYTPDFYLPEFDLWIEIKGWFRPKAKKKFAEFKKTYPEHNIELINESKLQELSIVK